MSDNDPVRVFARPFVRELARETNPVKVLENPLCSVRLDEVLSDPVSVLRNEVCAVGLEDRAIDPVSARKNVECSTRAEESPSELERFLNKPLTSDPAMDNDPVRVRERAR